MSPSQPSQSVPSRGLQAPDGVRISQIRVLVVSSGTVSVAPWYKLIQRRFAVTVTHDAESGYSLVRRTMPHVVVLDAANSELDVLDLCRRVREDQVDIPVLLLDESGSVDGLLAAFEAGADAYLRGRIDGPELRAQIGALARRYMTPPFQAGRAARVTNTAQGA